ncbi:hypothetical protein RJ55_04372 [Drechmeria coniospora]|nr:hypothetical protein RJ55_04372 [Drechmeria coniospora]
MHDSASDAHRRRSRRTVTTGTTRLPGTRRRMPILGQRTKLTASAGEEAEDPPRAFTAAAMRRNGIVIGCKPSASGWRARSAALCEAVSVAGLVFEHSSALQRLCSSWYGRERGKIVARRRKAQAHVPVRQAVRHKLRCIVDATAEIHDRGRGGGGAKEGRSWGGGGADALGRHERTLVAHGEGRGAGRGKCSIHSRVDDGPRSNEPEEAQPMGKDAEDGYPARICCATECRFGGGTYKLGRSWVGGRGRSGAQRLTREWLAPAMRRRVDDIGRKPDNALALLQHERYEPRKSVSRSGRTNLPYQERARTEVRDEAESIGKANHASAVRSAFPGLFLPRKARIRGLANRPGQGVKYLPSACIDSYA